jgi:hypothetical protein
MILWIKVKKHLPGDGPSPVFGQTTILDPLILNAERTVKSFLHDEKK